MAGYDFRTEGEKTFITLSLDMGILLRKFEKTGNK